MSVALNMDKCLTFYFALPRCIVIDLITLGFCYTLIKLVLQQTIESLNAVNVIKYFQVVYVYVSLLVQRDTTQVTNMY